MQTLKGRVGTLRSGMTLSLKGDGHVFRGTLGLPLVGDTLRLSTGYRGAAGEVKAHFLQGGRVRLQMAGQLNHTGLDLRLSGCLLGEPLQANVRRGLLEGHLGNGSTEHALFLIEREGRFQGQLVSPEGRSIGLNLRGNAPLTVAAVAAACAYACLYENGQNSGSDSSSGDSGGDGGWGDGDGGGDGGGGGGGGE
ncbi:hypothetical protein GCM10017783_00520 [Deinococcus piscis]|uniref:Uncharacterized protein n=1 Tax=Deinococcus piscis TaxID=394230 RepID=A0ABQ3JWT1_9DEIO|nr:hypothetical protein [Deinococcus piscis]GHF92622.1 hypothetical protein GCM10017783_00520 [Deinococcus piscis]